MLTNACNQKSNRDPALSLDEVTVQQTVDLLQKKHLVSARSGYGGRVTKYKQTFCNTGFGLLQLTDLERAIICELLLRGPQSAGELRTRCNRMTSIADVSEVETALHNPRRTRPWPNGAYVSAIGFSTDPDSLPDAP